MQPSACRGHDRSGAARRGDVLVDSAPVCAIGAPLEVPLGVPVCASRLRFFREVGCVEPGLKVGTIDRLCGLGGPRQLGELELVERLFLLRQLVGSIELLPTALILGRGVNLLERVNERVVAFLFGTRGRRTPRRWAGAASCAPSRSEGSSVDRPAARALRSRDSGEA